jgi:hypothetical protein
MKKVHNKDILKQHNVNIQYERSLEGQYAKIFIITTLKEGDSSYHILILK